MGPLTRALYHDRVDIYAPSTSAVNADKTGNDYSLSATPAFRNVRCRYQATPNFDVADPYGRQKIANIMTADAFHFGMAQKDVSDGWVIRLLTILQDRSRHPLYGTYWQVQGPVRVVAMMRKVECYAVIIPAPSGWI